MRWQTAFFFRRPSDGASCPMTCTTPAALQETAVCTQRRFSRALAPCSPLKIWKSFHQHRCCRNAETSVGSRRRAQPRTPALSLQPEQRPPRLSAFVPLPFLPSLIEARLPRPHGVSLPVPFVLSGGAAARQKQGGAGGIIPPACLFCLFCLSCVSCVFRLSFDGRAVVA